MLDGELFYLGTRGLRYNLLIAATTRPGIGWRDNRTEAAAAAGGTRRTKSRDGPARDAGVGYERVQESEREHESGEGYDGRQPARLEYPEI